MDARGRGLVGAVLRPVPHPDVCVVGYAAPVTADAIEKAARGEEPPRFRFRFLARSVGLGRADGVIRPVHADDSLRGPLVTGHAAARIGEWINRCPLLSLRGERASTGSYHWATPLGGARTAPRAAATTHAPTGS